MQKSATALPGNLVRSAMHDHGRAPAWWPRRSIEKLASLLSGHPKKGQMMTTYRFPVDPAKVDAIRGAKRDRGPAFPRIGLFIVSYNASHRLVETIRRIPSEG